MSYVYKYELQRLTENDDFNEEEILNIVARIASELFKFELKMCYVDKDEEVSNYYVKFDFYSPMDISKSRKLVSSLKKELVNEYGVKYKIKRVDNDFYAIVKSESEEFEVELLDSIVFDKFEKYKEEYEKYILKVRAEDKEDNKIIKSKIGNLFNGEVEINNQIYNNFFLPLLFCNDDSQTRNLFNSNIDDEIAVYRIKGRLISSRKNNEKQYDRICLDSTHDKFVCHCINKIDRNESLAPDYFQVRLQATKRNIRKVIDTIKPFAEREEKFHIDFGACKRIKLPKIKKDDNLKFKVHNVGQALSTSLSVNNIPFLYFDYGNYNKDLSLDVDEDTTIVISHNHVDHWNELEKLLDSDFLPNCICIMDDDQDYRMNQILCDLYAAKVHVRQIKNNTIIKLNSRRIYIGEIISIKNFVYGKKKVILDSKDKKMKIKYVTYNNKNSGVMFINYNNKKILVPGDQLYKNIDSKYREKIDILVATHHGGYYGSSNQYIPTPNNKKSVVVYSYGEKNKYGHPSKDKDYEDKNWNNYFKTAEKKGDFYTDM